MKRLTPFIVIILTILFYLPLLKANSVIVVTSGPYNTPAAAPTQTPSAYCHSYTSTCPGGAGCSTFWAGVCNGTPAPMALSSPVIVFQGGQPLKYLNGTTVPSGCTPFGDGPAGASTGSNGTAHDDTSCFNTAMNDGDVEVRPPAVAGGYYLMFSSAGSLPHLAFPSGRNIRGCTDPNHDCSSTTANYNPKDNSVAFGDEGDCSYGYDGFEQQASHYGGSFYGLQWRGINYQNMNKCTVDTSYGQEWITIGGAGTGGVTIAVNDFNGIAGHNGPIWLSSNDLANSPEETSVVIEWNWFTNDLVNSLELVRGTNNLAQWNYITGVPSNHGGGVFYGSDMFNNEPDSFGESSGNATVSCTGALSGVSGSMNKTDNCNLFRNIDYIIDPASTTITNTIFGISNSESGNFPTFNYAGNFQINTHQASTSSNANSVVMQEGNNGGAGAQGGTYWNNTCASADHCTITGTPSHNNTGSSCTNAIIGWCSNQ